MRSGGLPFEAGFRGQAPAAARPAVDPDDGEEDLEGDPHPEGEAEEGATRQHPGDAVHHARELARLEEHLHERGVVEVPDEALEGLHPATDAALVAAEAADLEAVVPERLED